MIWITRTEPGASRVTTALRDAGYEVMQGVLDDLGAKKITTPHDNVVGQALSRVLCGGDAQADEELSEWDVCDLERESFISLARTDATIARIEHTLTTGRPLRN